MFKKFILPLILLVLPCAAVASTVNVNMDSGWKQYKSLHGMRADTITRGRDLKGMVVTASYLDGTTEQVIWGEARNGGKATGLGFNLFFDWRAFELSVTKSLLSLSLDARTGNAIFDTTPSRRAGEDTYGTKNGYAFHSFGDYDPEGTIDVSYTHGFFITGHERATDAYTQMSIDFSGLEGGGLSNDFQFQTDLDSVAVAGDLSQVPLPASLLMFASAFGIMGAGVGRRRPVR
ncbi:MAG: hypothetical protein RLQ73_20525 [Hoeflea sp. D1-CHI-28]